MMFGSTDPGEPIEQMVQLAELTAGFVLLAVALMPSLRVLLVPISRGLVRLRRAE